MITHIEQPFDGLLVRLSSEFAVVFIISTADYSFGLFILISTVRKKNEIDESPLLMKQAVG